jgi:hypothetical protein
MTRLIKILILSIFFPVIISAQENDIFNLENSRKFADYLFDTRQFDLATVEFERVVFMAPDDSLSILKLIKAYRNEHKYEVGLKRAFDLLPATSNLSFPFLKELFLLQSHLEQHEENLQMIRDNQMLSEGQRNEMILSALMLNRSWEKGEAYFTMNQADDPYYSRLGNLLDERKTLKKKSPYLASGLSVLLPGMGKIYTRDWADGIITLGFVATSAWQAYRGFNEDGIKSIYGWIFGSIGAGFYLGNIYGSFKGARNYNKRIDNAHYEKVSGTVYNHY